MKILIAYEGSSCVDSALEDMRRAGLPRKSEAIVLSVAKLWSLALENDGAGEETFVEALPILLEKIESLAQRACERVQSYIPDWTLKAEARQGSPASVIIKRAWEADCVFVGARGLSRFERFRLGSVSAATAARAHCSVEVVRPGGRAE